MQRQKVKRRPKTDTAEKRNKQILGQRREKRATQERERKHQITVEDVVAKYPSLAKDDVSGFTTFRQFPLSEKTLKGLDEAEFVSPTEIQRDSLPFSLTSSDVVGAAKTGSGKTLALVIPMLECLWRERWSRKTDGLGALIISPTRELALQTYNTINKVGKYHDFSCALLMGGTDVNFEKKRIHGVNIVVCTPGRLQQHLDENELFHCQQLLMLIIDEADRILDMGFSTQMNAIVSCIPAERQTLLFSATQTNDVKQLSRVCTNDPVFVSVHEKASNATPENLRQSFLVCNEEEKVNILWSFITHHKHAKTLVFVSSCKQVRFLTEIFCHLRPGVSLLGLWGTMKQPRRLAVLEKFEQRKAACLIATDVASRGLDFAAVDWVVQMDAPATVDDYIHRVGRTARMNKKGASLLFLTPNQETTMQEQLKTRKIPIAQTQHDPSSLIDLRPKMQNVLARFTDLKDLGQKYVVSYLRSIYFMKNKKMFDVDAVDAKALAESLGLVAIKRIRFLQKKKNANQKLVVKEEQVFSGHSFGERDGASEEDDDEEGELFALKRSDVFNAAAEEDRKAGTSDGLSSTPSSSTSKKEKVVTKLKEAKAILKKGLVVNMKTTFNEDGEELNERAKDWRAQGLDLQAAVEEMPVQDKIDREQWREKQRAARKEKKRKEKEAARKKRRPNEESCVSIGGDSDDEEGSVDLSWLPDPDNPMRMSDDEEEEEKEDDKKRKRTPSESEVSTIRKRPRKEVEDAEAAAVALLMA